MSVKILRILANKSFLVVFLALLAIAGVWWIVLQNTPREVENIALPATVTLGGEHAAVIAAAASQDRDSDGLADWEEELWGTDPNNSDSDGDGTPDGEEVAARRHPARPGPDDAIATTHTGGVTESIRTRLADENTTETNKIALALFEGYLQLKQKGSLGGFEETQLVNRLVRSSTATVNVNPYERYQLTIVPDSKEARVAYKKEYGAIVARLSDVGESELLMLERALSSGKESDIAALDGALAVYTDVLSRLLRMQVPEELADTHLALANSFVLLNTGLEGMRAALDDPIRASAGVRYYFESTERLSAAFRKLNSALAAYDV